MKPKHLKPGRKTGNQASGKGLKPRSGVAKRTEPKKSAKNKLRDIQRLLQRGTLPPAARAKKEEELAQIQLEYEKQQRAELEREYAIKYHKVKFFERQKVERRIKQLEKAKDAGPLTEEQQAQLLQLQDDLLYIKHFPKGEKYISLLKTPDDPEAMQRLESERVRLRALVRAQLQEQALLTEADEGRALQARLERTAVAPGAAALGKAADPDPDDDAGDSDFFLEDGSDQEGEVPAMAPPSPRQAPPTTSPPLAKGAAKKTALQQGLPVAKRQRARNNLEPPTGKVQGGPGMPPSMTVASVQQQKAKKIVFDSSDEGSDEDAGMDGSDEGQEPQEWEGWEHETSGSEADDDTAGTSDDGEGQEDASAPAEALLVRQLAAAGSKRPRAQQDSRGPKGRAAARTADITANIQGSEARQPEVTGSSKRAKLQHATNGTANGLPQRSKAPDVPAPVSAAASPAAQPAPPAKSGAKKHQPLAALSPAAPLVTKPAMPAAAGAADAPLDTNQQNDRPGTGAASSQAAAIRALMQQLAQEGAGEEVVVAEAAHEANLPRQRQAGHGDEPGEGRRHKEPQTLRSAPKLPEAEAAEGNGLATKAAVKVHASSKGDLQRHDGSSRPRQSSNALEHFKALHNEGHQRRPAPGAAGQPRKAHPSSFEQRHKRKAPEVSGHQHARESNGERPQAAFAKLPERGREMPGFKSGKEYAVGHVHVGTANKAVMQEKQGVAQHKVQYVRERGGVAIAAGQQDTTATADQQVKRRTRAEGGRKRRK